MEHARRKDMDVLKVLKNLHGFSKELTDFATLRKGFLINKIDAEMAQPGKAMDC